jgi:choline dehydrogenase-like flavoprotein
MISDFDQLPTPVDLRADVCIVGAGAAGITVAREFKDSSAKVILLESGGSEFDAATQDLYAGENTGRPYNILDCRLRYFGGSTNHWEGVCGPLEEIDFETRPWVPDSGWPLSRKELRPFYERAQTVCKLGPFRYGDDAWSYIGRKGLPFDDKKIRYGFRQFRDFPVRFGVAYGNELRHSRNVQVFFHANVTNVQLDADGRRVSHLDLRSLQGKTGRISARYYVIACGAIENARLLLVSNSVESQGVGNRHGLVGRYFQEHAQFIVGQAFPKDEDRIRQSFLQEFVTGVRFAQHLTLAPEVQEREQVLNSLIYPREVAKADSGMAGVRQIMRVLRHSKGHTVHRWDETVWRILMDLDDVAINTFRRVFLGKGTMPPLERIDLKVESEQAPNPESRVTIIREKDALGLNRGRLHWTLSDLERRTMVVMGKTLAAEFGRLGLGRVKLNEEILKEGGAPLPGHFGYHQMGTTRMADSAAKGVVDRHCLIHGLDNTFISGSSVFPTSGHMNPTLTIVALALRLAGHLKTKLS